MIFYQPSRAVSQERGNERCKSAYGHVVHNKRRAEIGEHTANPERGHRFGKEQRQNCQCFRRTDLYETVIGDCAEGVGERDVQRGDYSRAANSLGGKKVFHLIFRKFQLKKRLSYEDNLLKICFSSVFLLMCLAENHLLISRRQGTYKRAAVVLLPLFFVFLFGSFFLFSFLLAVAEESSEINLLFAAFCAARRSYAPV